MEYSQADHERWMQEAIKLAQKAEQLDEVPVGAVIVRENEIVGRGFNQPISATDPTAHAEIMALRDAAQNIGNYRLVDCLMYVTIEPCTMCVGAMIHARIKQVIYGAPEAKSGAVFSNGNLLDAAYMNHRVEPLGGILVEECSQLMSDFFKRRRAQKRV